MRHIFLLLPSFSLTLSLCYNFLILNLFCSFSLSFSLPLFISLCLTVSLVFSPLLSLLVSLSLSLCHSLTVPLSFSPPSLSLFPSLSMARYVSLCHLFSLMLSLCTPLFFLPLWNFCPNAFRQMFFSPSDPSVIKKRTYKNNNMFTVEYTVVNLIYVMIDSFNEWGVK